MARSKGGTSALPFEKPIEEVLQDLEALRRAHAEGKKDLSKEIRDHELRSENLIREIFARLSPWQRVQVARHPNRPLVSDYAESWLTDPMELHGDRRFGDDPAILTTLGRIGSHRVLLVGHRKGKDVKEKVACHFGMAHPEGYRKAMLKMRLAERFGLPIVCLIDTPGAYPGIGAEERGQAWAIAENIQDMTGLRVPVVVAVVGEGGSGGALGIGIGDRVLMLENAYYSVISPEGCAAILWKSGDQAPEAARELKLIATDLERLGIVDEVVAEPLGGAHRNPGQAAASLKQAIVRALDDLGGVPVDVMLRLRYEKFRRIGAHLFN
ncbi:MAG: acetyl-CoA carboxylase carboxyltransferase subunit alpha [Planctomycetes bacterium]|nr:acetyl-CoA carboxylase carboxyltransferase subunit alpha [Planctomycetota bacterium]